MKRIGVGSRILQVGVANRLDGSCACGHAYLHLGVRADAPILVNHLNDDKSDIFRFRRSRLLRKPDGIGLARRGQYACLTGSLGP